MSKRLEENEKTIALSDDWHQSAYGPDSLMGYAVPDGKGEHKVFASVREARRYAELRMEDHPEDDVLIYPLVAAEGCSISEIPRTWE